MIFQCFNSFHFSAASIHFIIQKQKKNPMSRVVQTAPTQSVAWQAIYPLYERLRRGETVDAVQTTGKSFDLDEIQRLLLAIKQNGTVKEISLDCK